MHASKRPRAGVALLEAMLALLLFGLVGTSLMTLARAVLVANAHARQNELETVEASRLMEAVVLWPVEDLNRRLGSRAQGQFRLDIERVSPSLFSLRIVNSSTRELVRTVVYRPLPNPQQ